MIIKFCPQCDGRPYTEDLDRAVCPVCGAGLDTEMVSESGLRGRPVLSFGGLGGEDAAGPAEEKAAGEGSDFVEAPVLDNDPKLDWIPDTGALGLDEDAGRAGILTLGQRLKNAIVRVGSSFVPTTRGEDRPVETGPRSAPAVPFFPSGETQREERASARNVGNVIRGKVANYTNTDMEGGRYRRLGICRTVDLLLYRQRLEDVLHRFTVRVDLGRDSFGNQQYADIPVNVHGTISGGLCLGDNQEVQVSGQYRNGVLMARKIEIVNNGFHSAVTFQHSVGAIACGIMVALTALFAVLLAACISEDFSRCVSAFFTQWLVTAVVLSVLYFMACFSKLGLFFHVVFGRPAKFPLVPILVISALAALLFSGGLGAAGLLSGLIASVTAAVIVGAVFYICFKALKS